MKPDEIRCFLRNAEAKDRLASSYLIHGGNEKDREETARFLASLLCCTREPRPCGACAFCRQVEKGVHPDVRWIVPSKRFLSIDDVRPIRDDIYLKPYSGNRRVYVYVVEFMRDEAANAFLKILEEPPPHGVLVLLSSNISYFLPTIISRCQRLYLNPRLPEMDETTRQVRQELANLVKSVRLEDMRQFFRDIDGLARNLEREEVERLLDYALWMYRDGMLRRESCAEHLVVDATAGGCFLGEGDLLDKMDRILQMRDRMSANVNIRLTLETLFLHLAG